MSASLALLLTVALVLGLGPGPACARTLLLPNAGTVAGEVAPLMAGAQVALAGGPEALFHNPAGLALEARTVATAGAQPATWQEADAGEAERAFGSGPGFFALADPLGSARGYPRFAYGVGLSWPLAQEITLRYQDESPGTEASLPPGLADSGDVDSALPGGFTIRERSDGLGRLRAGGPGLGLAVAVADWFRVGAGLRIERVTLSQRSRTDRFYEGRDSNGSVDELDGHSLNELVLQGHADRLVYALGLQVDLGPGATAGLVLRLPSDHLSGAGRVYLNRDRHLLLTSDGSPVAGYPRDELVVIDEEDVAFRLESPRALHLGLAFRFDWMVAELDVIRVGEQSAYEVFPAAESGPSSTDAARLGPLRTAGEGTTRMALGLAFSGGPGTSYLLGLAVDPAATPADDPLFRRLNLLTVSGGIYRTAGRFSGAAGVSYRFADAPAVRLAEPGTEADAIRPVSYTHAAVHLAGSVAF